MEFLKSFDFIFACMIFGSNLLVLDFFHLTKGVPIQDQMTHSYLHLVTKLKNSPHHCSFKRGSDVYFGSF